ncbi:MAG: AAA family ATPase, partial [Actinomycetes bacterium]
MIRRMELLEREEPLEVLSGLLTRAATRGRIVLVAGEAGVGKSALVNEFATRSGVRARVVWGACDPLSTPRALGPLRDVGRQIGGALAGTLTADGTREDAFAALLDALGDPHQPARLVVVVEDAHWADEATLDMLMFLGRRVAATRALIVVTYRDDEVGPDHPLPAALSVLPRDAVSRVTLSPLSMASVTAIAQRAGRDPAAVHELTGGNPLLVSELVEALDDDVPATVRELMLARLRN